MKTTHLIQAPSLARGFIDSWPALQQAITQRGTRKQYLAVILIVMAVSTGLQVAGGYAVWSWTDVVIAASDTSWWAEAWSWVQRSGLWLARIVGIILVMLASPYVAIQAVAVAVPALADNLFSAGLAIKNPATAQAFDQLKSASALVTLVRSVKRLSMFAAVFVVTAILGLLPLVGQAAGFAFWFYTARAMGEEMFDPLWDRYQRRDNTLGKNAAIGRYRGWMTGFGFTASLLMAIPIIGPLFYAVVQVGAGVAAANVVAPALLGSSENEA